MIANSQMWGALFWLAIAGYVTWAGQDLGIGKLHEPGSGFALYWIGLIMVALSLATLAQSLMRGAESIGELWAGTRWGKVLLVVVMLLVFGFFFEWLGFIVCSMALLLTLMLFVDPVKPWLALPTRRQAAEGRLEFPLDEPSQGMAGAVEPELIVLA